MIRRALLVLALVAASLGLTAGPAAAGHGYSGDYCGHGYVRHWAVTEEWQRTTVDFGRHFHEYKITRLLLVRDRVIYKTRVC